MLVSAKLYGYISLSFTSLQIPGRHELYLIGLQISNTQTVFDTQQKPNSYLLNKPHERTYPVLLSQRKTHSVLNITSLFRLLSLPKTASCFSDWKTTYHF